MQTHAVLLMHKELNFDTCVFSDTGGEWPETMEYLQKYSLPYCKENGIKFIVVRAAKKVKLGDTEYSVKDSDEPDAIIVDNLEEFCKIKQIIPSRQDRWCTHQFKINPIRKWVKDSGCDLPAVAIMGISFDEIHRVHDAHWSEYTFEHPLVDRHITREDCKRIILEHGWPLPPKSGCYYCPFQRQAQWKKLYHDHPDLYNSARELEELSTSFPSYTLGGVALGKLAIRLGEGSEKITDYIEPEDACDSGSCMT